MCAVSRSLSPREREVLRLLLANHTTKEISGMLNLAIQTVKNHQQGLMKKMGVRSRRDLRLEDLE